jgi:hypothetical protein
MRSMPLTIIDWGSVADWVSGIGSFAAAVVALYIVVYSQRVKLRAWCGLRTIPNDDEWPLPIDVLAISAKNVSPRPTTVTNISFTCWRRDKYVFVKFMQDHGNALPTPLSDGQTGTWYIPMNQSKKVMDPSNNFANDLVDRLEMTRVSVATLRIHIQTSNGGTKPIRPEKAFRKVLMSTVIGKKIVKNLAK